MGQLCKALDNQDVMRSNISLFPPKGHLLSRERSGNPFILSALIFLWIAHAFKYSFSWFNETTNNLDIRWKSTRSKKR